MADENALAETPDEKAAEIPANDGIVDLDAVEVVAEPKDSDDPDAEAVEAKPDGDEEPAKEDDKPKKPSGSKRIKLQNQHLLRELQEAQRKIDELSRHDQSATKVVDSDEKPPREEDFNGDYFAWQRALTAFEAGKAARDAIAREFRSKEESERTSKQQEIVRERAVSHAERVEEAREIIADFDQVMDTMKGVNVRNDVIDEIMASDKSALLAYHLAKHPNELQALNQMSPRELARSMGRLEATVSLPTPKKQTSAPPPLSSVKGGTAPRSVDSDLSAWLKKTYG